MNWLQEQPVVLQAFLAGLFTWGCTIVGSAVVFFFKTVSRKLLDIMMGFAAGVMIAASFWSLLQPSIEYAKGNYGVWSWMPAALGFLLGGFFLRFIDAVVPHLARRMYLRQKVCRSTAGINCPKQPCFFWLLPYTIFQKDWQ